MSHHMHMIRHRMLFLNPTATAAPTATMPADIGSALFPRPTPIAPSILDGPAVAAPYARTVDMVARYVALAVLHEQSSPWIVQRLQPRRAVVPPQKPARVAARGCPVQEPAVTRVSEGPVGGAVDHRRPQHRVQFMTPTDIIVSAVHQAARGQDSGCNGEPDAEAPERVLESRLLRGRSCTTTLRPVRASVMAAARPAGPAPII
jgi:hypothetical protein